jgi:hypothetical protein
MHIQKKDNYTLVGVDTSFDEFKEGIDALKSNHLVLEVSENLNIDDAIISLFLELATDFKQNGMSFVMVKPNIDIDDFPETLNIVPTLQEAEDVLEMEAIERDLGF